MMPAFLDDKRFLIFPLPVWGGRCLLIFPVLVGEHRAADLPLVDCSPSALRVAIALIIEITAANPEAPPMATPGVRILLGAHLRAHRFRIRGELTRGGVDGARRHQGHLSRLEAFLNANVLICRNREVSLVTTCRNIAR